MQVLKRKWVFITGTPGLRTRPTRTTSRARSPPAGTMSGVNRNRPQSNPAHIASSLATRAYELAAGISDIPVPFDSYLIVGKVASAARSLTESLDQIAAWHNSANEEQHYTTADADGGRADVASVAEDLTSAARHMREAMADLERAHATSGQIAWRGRLDE